MSFIRYGCTVTMFQHNPSRGGGGFLRPPKPLTALFFRETAKTAAHPHGIHGGILLLDNIKPLQWAKPGMQPLEVWNMKTAQKEGGMYST